MTDLDTLRAVADRLQAALDRQVEELESSEWLKCDPFLAKSSDGRYLLTETLVALVQARTAIVQAERTPA